jgi:hypothetical protein
MEPGRNALCPCGSGKKFKKCCMVKEHSLSLTHHLLSRTSRNVVEPLLKYGRKIYGASAFFYAWEDIWADPIGDFEDDHPILQIASPWFLYHWYPDDHISDELDFPHPDTIVSRYLKDNSGKLDRLTRKFLESARREPLTFWEAEEVEPGKGLLLKDLVTDREYFVTEVSGSESLKKWDIIFGQVVGMEGEYILNATGPYTLTPFLFRESILTFINSIREQIGPVIDPVALLDYDIDFIFCYLTCVDQILNPTPSEIRNMDNEKLVFTKSRFSFRPEDRLAILAKLRSMRNFENTDGEEGEINFAWIIAQKDKDLEAILKGYIAVGKDHIETECNSKQRDKRLKTRLVSNLDPWIKYEETTYRDMEDIEPDGIGSYESDESDELDLNALPEEERKEIIGFLEKQFMGWAKQKIPALGNLTPRQAIKTESGKKQVIALINSYENSHEIMSNPQFRFDFNKLRRTLGIEEE